MSFLAKNNLSRLCWVLALLASLQPYFVFGCVCSSHSHSPCCHDEGSCDLTCCEDDHSTCGHHESSENTDPFKTSEDSVLSDFLIHECNCPDGCDCQWRHSSVHTADRVSNQTEEFFAEASISCFSLPVVVPAEIPLSRLRFKQPADSLICTALAFCAQKCRFLA